MRHFRVSEVIWPPSRTVEHPQDLNRVSHNLIRHDEGGLGDDELSGPGDASRASPMGRGSQGVDSFADPFQHELRDVRALLENVVKDFVEVVFRFGRDDDLHGPIVIAHALSSSWRDRFSSEGPP